MSKPIYTTPKLALYYDDRRRKLHSIERHQWYICGEGVDEVFHIPKSANFVWFCAYSEPGSHRVKIEQYRDKILVDGRPREFLDNEVLEVLSDLFGQYNTEPIYVECEYE